MAMTAIVAVTLCSCGGNNARRAIEQYAQRVIDWNLLPGYVGQRVYWVDENGMIKFELPLARSTRYWSCTATPFYGDVALYTEPGETKYTIIDKEGNALTEFKGDIRCFKGFAEGILFVELGSIPEKTRALNTAGEEAFVFEGKAESPIYGGYFIYRNGYNTGVMDKDGNVLFEANDDEKVVGQSTAKPELFTLVNKDKDIVAVLDVKTGKRMFENLPERLSVVFEWSLCSSVVDWNGQMIVEDSETDKCGVVGSDGAWVIEPDYDELVNDGDWYLFKQDGLWGWMGKGGKVVIEAQFENMPNPFGGSDWAYVKDRKCFIDRKGNNVLDCSYELGPLTTFLGDRCLVQTTVGDRNGNVTAAWMDRKGNLISEEFRVSSDANFAFIATKIGRLIASPF